MSQLENRVKPVVEILLDELPVSLDLQAQTILAAWAVKTAMVFEALGTKRVWFYSNSERKFLRDQLQVPLRTGVWIAKCVDPPAAYCSATQLRGDTPSVDGDVCTYATTMSFGPLAIQVITTRMPDEVPVDTRVTADVRVGPWDLVALPVWPSQSRATAWPPTVGLAGEMGLSALSDRLNPGGGEANSGSGLAGA
jgi:hypothetical protein